MTTQLTIDVPVQRNVNDKYVSALSEYEKDIRAGYKNIYLCYSFVTKSYFSTRYQTKSMIESFNKIQIIK